MAGTAYAILEDHRLSEQLIRVVMRFFGVLRFNEKTVGRRPRNARSPAAHGPGNRTGADMLTAANGNKPPKPIEKRRAFE